MGGVADARVGIEPAHATRQVANGNQLLVSPLDHHTAAICAPLSPMAQIHWEDLTTHTKSADTALGAFTTPLVLTSALFFFETRMTFDQVRERYCESVL